ncbi:MAG: STAS domain-containing protein [Leptospiraceae bacterium]|nr:STAS domain-containing protein [Leptospiraceae bacterium]
MTDLPKYDHEQLDAATALFRPRGNLDIYTSPEFRRIMDDCRESGTRHFILDLSGVDYIDSTGLGSLASFMDLLKKNQGSLRLSGLTGVVHKAFVFTNLLDLFHIFDTAQDAIQSLKQ